MTAAVTTATDAIAVAEQALDELARAYRDNPKSAGAGLRYGHQLNRLLALKRSAKPKPTYVAPEPTPVFLTNGAWSDALPSVCPACEGRGTGGFEPPYRAAGFTTRLGNLGARCELCRHEYSLEEQ